MPVLQAEVKQMLTIKWCGKKTQSGIFLVSNSRGLQQFLPLPRPESYAIIISNHFKSLSFVKPWAFTVGDIIFPVHFILNVYLFREKRDALV